MRLAAAYGRHQVRRRFRRPEPGKPRLLETYAPDRLLPLTGEERKLLPRASRCINCGLCALVAARVGGLRPPDLASAYLRDYPRLAAAVGEVGSGPVSEPESAPLEAAAAACPMGVPLAEVLAAIRRLASA